MVKNMTKKENKSKKKISKKRSTKYQKKLTLYGMDEKEVLKKMLETPPMGEEVSEGKDSEKSKD